MASLNCTWACLSLSPCKYIAYLYSWGTAQIFSNNPATLTDTGQMKVVEVGQLILNITVSPTEFPPGAHRHADDGLYCGDGERGEGDVLHQQVLHRWTLTRRQTRPGAAVWHRGRSHHLDQQGMLAHGHCFGVRVCVRACMPRRLCALMTTVHVLQPFTMVDTQLFVLKRLCETTEVLRSEPGLQSSPDGSTSNVITRKLNDSAFN